MQSSSVTGVFNLRNFFLSRRCNPCYTFYVCYRGEYNKKMKKFLWFLIPFIITFALFCYPYMKTRNAPSYDGNTVIGYPLIAYSFGGGMCAFDGPNGMGGKGGCPPAFFLENMLVDLLFVFGIPLACYLLILMKAGRAKR